MAPDLCGAPLNLSSSHDLLKLTCLKPLPRGAAIQDATGSFLLAVREPVAKVALDTPHTSPHHSPHATPPTAHAHHHTDPPPNHARAHHPDPVLPCVLPRARALSLRAHPRVSEDPPSHHLPERSLFGSAPEAKPPELCSSGCHSCFLLILPCPRESAGSRLDEAKEVAYGHGGVWIA